MKLNQMECLFITVLLVISIIPHSHQLECYVCQNQPDNKNKCAETVKICDLSQDQCLTEVRWGSIPYWSLTDQKQHFISKRCATKQECQEAMSDRSRKCDRIWYNDWNCTNCCSGDKCNYYVTLAGHSLKPTNILVAIVAVVTTFMTIYQSVYTI
uniref:UPAR/Ly6 domain-containing protein n=1 Tax=Aceria tosichella TaxID=561515 RepID=A0A6G1SL87_9ACAR